ncbi:glycosyltransferase family 4 protein [Gabonia massiliensis]|uniref:glycosyltransferase family 4 protein n=1 Tax=Gabonia massiliensis TaxID=1686296 RepID=UPI0006D7CC9F|nr:glycosyltransferase [Gabonia massiliensis]
MNILIINTILYSGKGRFIPKVKSIKDTMIYNLGLGFVHEGHNITLIAGAEFIPTEQEVYDFKILFFKSGLKNILYPSVIPFTPRLFSYLLSNHKKYDFIISSEVVSINTLIATIICPQKTIIWQELGDHQRLLKKMPSKIWYNIIAPLFMRKAIIVPRSNISQQFIKKYLPQISNTIIGHGVNQSRLISSKKKKKQFIIIARLIPTKNIANIIKKFDRFLSKYNETDYILYIAGKGELEQDLKKFVKALNREKNIIFLGHIDHQTLGEKKYLAEATASFADTLQDLNMISLFESISSGTPVITNRIPYNSVEIEQNGLGIVKDNWNEDDIKAIIDNNNEYTDRCLQYKNNLSIESTAKKFIQVYKDYIENKLLQR